MALRVLAQSPKRTVSVGVGLALAASVLEAIPSLGAPQSRLGRAILDSSAHAAVGACTYAASLALEGATMLDSGVVAAAVLSSALDVDHFLAARSASLADAVSLRQRPFAHTVTVGMLLVAAAGGVAGRRGGAVAWAAAASHQLRDALGSARKPPSSRAFL